MCCSFLEASEAQKIVSCSCLSLPSTINNDFDYSSVSIHYHIENISIDWKELTLIYSGTSEEDL